MVLLSFSVVMGVVADGAPAGDGVYFLPFSLE